MQQSGLYEACSLSQVKNIQNADFSIESQGQSDLGKSEFQSKNEATTLAKSKAQQSQSKLDVKLCQSNANRCHNFNNSYRSSVSSTSNYESGRFDQMKDFINQKHLQISELQNFIMNEFQNIENMKSSHEELNTKISNVLKGQLICLKAEFEDFKEAVLSDQQRICNDIKQMAKSEMMAFCLNRFEVMSHELQQKDKLIQNLRRKEKQSFDFLEEQSKKIDSLEIELSKVRLNQEKMSLKSSSSNLASSEAQRSQQSYSRCSVENKDHSSVLGEPKIKMSKQRQGQQMKKSQVGGITENNTKHMTPSKSSCKGGRSGAKKSRYDYFCFFDENSALNDRKEFDRDQFNVEQDNHMGQLSKQKSQLVFEDMRQTASLIRSNSYARFQNRCNRERTPLKQSISSSNITNSAMENMSQSKNTSEFTPTKYPPRYPNRNLQSLTKSSLNFKQEEGFSRYCQKVKNSTNKKTGNQQGDDSSSYAQGNSNYQNRTKLGHLSSSVFEFSQSQQLEKSRKVTNSYMAERKQSKTRPYQKDDRGRELSSINLSQKSQQMAERIMAVRNGILQKENHSPYVPKRKLNGSKPQERTQNSHSKSSFTYSKFF